MAAAREDAHRIKAVAQTSHELDPGGRSNQRSAYRRIEPGPGDRRSLELRRDLACEVLRVLAEPRRQGGDTRVDHEIYRAVEVEVETDVRIVPREQIAASAGQDVFNRALEISGLEEEDVLFAAIASAKCGLLVVVASGVICSHSSR